MINDTKNHHYSSMGTSNNNKKQEISKTFMIKMSHTIIDPRAMVIHFHATSKK